MAAPTMPTFDQLVDVKDAIADAHGRVEHIQMRVRDVADRDAKGWRRSGDEEATCSLEQVGALACFVADSRLWVEALTHDLAAIEADLAWGLTDIVQAA